MYEAEMYMQTVRGHTSLCADTNLPIFPYNSQIRACFVANNNIAFFGAPVGNPQEIFIFFTFRILRLNFGLKNVKVNRLSR